MGKEKSYSELEASQIPAIELLKNMGYKYISPEECNNQRGNLYNVLLKDILEEQLQKINKIKFRDEEKKFSLENIKRAIKDLNEPLTTGLITTSEKIYDTLLLGRSYNEILNNGRSYDFNLKYIDWDNFENNVFHVTEEFSVDSLDKEKNARPDIVLFINGIPFGVIECKAPTINISQAVEQNLRNQTENYIPQLFKFSQIIMATNKNDVKYATTGTPEKYWNIWKEQDLEFLNFEISKHIVGRTATIQDKNIISLFSIERVKEFIKYFVLYDAGTKKICRYQQYFAIKEIIKTINSDDASGNRQGGVIWHTQGSGKSLTMVMLAKYILMEMKKVNPKIIITTDRKALDGQIAATFSHSRLKPAKASSGNHLVSLINENKVDIITTVINKFEIAEKSNIKNDSRNIFVLVDESHRSNYGQLATKMRVVFPNACYVGFTGTPLMKKEKNTMKKFGKIIHKYTISDGVQDGTIVPLVYEGKFVEQKVDEQNIDLWFDRKTRDLTDSQKIDLKKKWSSLKRLTSTDARIRRIALDIEDHFTKGYKESGFKAMLATNLKKDAVRYLECFQEFSDLRCEVVISAPDMREGVEDIDSETDDKVIKFWDRMMKKYKTPDSYEETITNEFKDGNIDILIVCSKLLTGFDAPICQILYIDKQLKEHGLLQAIARANRIYEGKDYGLIVDYRGLLPNLNEAMETYSGESGLDKFEEEDLKGTVVDILSVLGKLRESYSQVKNLFNNLNNENDIEEIEISLENNKLRESFYNLLSEFGRNLNFVLNSEKAYETMKREEIEKYKSEFLFYSKVRRAIKIRYADGIDNKEYEKQMQNLLDKHILVSDLKKITPPVDILNKDDFREQLQGLTSPRSRADSIRSGLTKTITSKREEDPAYYDSFSKKIKETLEEYKNKVISDGEYLSKMEKIMDDFLNRRSKISVPDKIKDNVHARAFYGVLLPILNDLDKVIDEDLISDLALEVTNIIKENCQVDWRENKIIHNRIAREIEDLILDKADEKEIDISFDTIDEIIENVKTVAIRRF
ncbi:type I restriction endonuclease subunit R [Fusobacterium sp. MFO224]|uniref:type I restriction endonuclease subunit R n=1 Tax=Fusobacterium sp. MFO224 TaxID=3378070 RepID=UPI003854453A